jgi:hypothetical protein
MKGCPRWLIRWAWRTCQRAVSFWTADTSTLLPSTSPSNMKPSERFSPSSRATASSRRGIFKAGYYHVMIHPRFRTYFGFKFGKTYFHYNAMCFGWSKACFAYTLVTQEAARELRLRQIPVASYLDDGPTGHQQYVVCLWIIIMIVRFLTLLGAVFSLNK